MQALGAVLVDAKGDTADELRAELATLKAQADSPKPKWEIIKAAARSIKSVAEGQREGLLQGLPSRTWQPCSRLQPDKGEAWRQTM